jgi:hypothetical protein
MKKLIFLFILAAMVYSCKKDNSAEIKQNITRQSLSAEQSILRDKLKNAALIISEVVRDEEINEEFKAAIKEKLTINPGDEALTINELINSKTQLKSGQVSKIHVFATKFSTRLKECGQKSKLLKSFPTKSVAPLSGINELDGLEIYFPYSENYQTAVNPTVTFSPLDNDDVGTGYYYNLATKNYTEVAVDDSYASSNPTYVIMPEESEPADYPYAIYFPKSDINQTIKIGTEINGALNDPTPSNIGLVSFGKVRCTDVPGLFEGKREFRIIIPKIDYTLNTDGQLVTKDIKVAAIAAIDISRTKVKEMFFQKDTYVTLGSVFVSNWKTEIEEVPLIIYEYNRPLLGGSTPFKLGGKIAGQEVNAEVNLPGSAYIKSSFQLSRDTYWAYKNIRNPNHYPGILKNWRTWGTDQYCTTLEKE